MLHKIKFNYAYMLELNQSHYMHIECWQRWQQLTTSYSTMLTTLAYLCVKCLSFVFMNRINWCQERGSLSVPIKQCWFLRHGTCQKWYAISAAYAILASTQQCMNFFPTYATNADQCQRFSVGVGTTNTAYVFHPDNSKYLTALVVQCLKSLRRLVQ